MEEIEQIRRDLFKLRSLSKLHDYHDKGTHIENLGIYEEELELIRGILPSGWEIIEKKKVKHDHGVWLRVDIVPTRGELS